jgi:hypothetical protein
MEDPSTYGIVLQNFQSILTFPLWLFNSNSWDNRALVSNQIISTLPLEFYTQASIVAPYTKIKFSVAMFILFVIFQGLAIIFVWSVLLFMVLGVKVLPKTSSYPLFDIAFKATVDSEAKEKEIMKDSKAFVKRE